MADQISFTPLRALDRNGDPVAGALARFYLTGTTTLETVYSDTAGTVPHASPLVADGRGVFAAVYSNASLKVSVTDPAGAVLPGFPMDPAPKTQIGSAGASGITFTPTAEIPVENVQAAIEAVQGNITSGGQGFGLGVTGSAVVLASIDATTTPSGRYRVTGATTGTFPAGMAAVDGGIVDFARETAAAASQTIYHGATERRATRDLVAGVWGAWREDMTVNQTLVAGDLVYYDGTNFLRLAKGTAGQALVMNTGATAPQWGGVFTKEYISAEQTITAAGALTLAHGLGVIPKLLTYELVCKAANLGYSIGAIVPIGIMAAPAGSDEYNAAANVDATNVTIRFAITAGTFNLLHATTGANALITNASWRLVVRAYA